VQGVVKEPGRIPGGQIEARRMTPTFGLLNHLQRVCLRGVKTGGAIGVLEIKARSAVNRVYSEGMGDATNVVGGCRCDSRDTTFQIQRKTRA